MTNNPAIHRRPSGDVDIAVPQDEPEQQRDAAATGSKNGAGDISGPPTTAE
ncbi:hypothetical protein I6A60_23390 [Frankia sp. AgB1.9]|jgi:hypothetical protein|uniref:hypothetical protein n=1 Tax=unclassified Frankia TaxID=2632575 RepID=UPI001932AF62|nr:MULTISPECIES: hypothetical protein [unclassified Frankia]MBL7491661.1 hypothetical protein [Frankia sp. AgW1.1]MBL7550792.1 hypothetical protein [Frankia sp. AgB1.9]MBL7618342.1 hypothetical protein [Frankia sp. AgB1.8]